MMNSEMFCNLLETMVGSEVYDEFMELFAEMELADRTIILPTTTTLGAQKRKREVFRLGKERELAKAAYLEQNPKAKRVSLRELWNQGLSWAQIAEKAGYKSPRDTEELYKSLKHRTAEWSKEGYMEMYVKCIYLSELLRMTGKLPKLKK